MAVIGGVIFIIMHYQASSSIVSSVKGLIPANFTPVNVSQGRMSLYFTRHGITGQDPANVLKVLYSKVPPRGYIYVAIYSLTHPTIIQALLDAKKRGVDVFVITDTEQSRNLKQKTALRILKEAGIPVKQNTYHGLMHLKLSVINDIWATTGSFNYTSSASTINKENLLVIPSGVGPDVIKQYREEFEKLWNNAEDYQ